MAKVKTNPEDELQEKVNPAETPVEELNEDAAGTGVGEGDDDEKIKASRVAREVKTAPGAKNIKIQVVEPVDCIIAGIPYKLAKDKSYEVPSDVAAVLNNAKKAYRI